MSRFFDEDFDPAESAEKAAQWIRDFFEENGKGCNAVVAVSGGKDSSVTAALCVKALGKDRVIGVMMPNGEQRDKPLADLLIETLGIRGYTVDISGSYNATMNELDRVLPCEISEQTRINLAPRLRMSTVYAVSQSLNGRVANTCNLSEDWVGYSTRYGDTAGDFSPLSRFTVQEVKAIGTALGLPDVLVNKVPDDGLSGMSDEEKLGFTYDTLDRYIRTGVIDDQDDKEKIDRLHRINLFKLSMMPAYEHEGPVKA
ncbi:MAG: NAD(+) synthase [Eubacterium sp.]|nr:NAD(+) synthase [Eubacterium sp.]